MSTQNKRNEVLVATQGLAGPLQIWVAQVREAFGEVEGGMANSVLMLLNSVRWHLVTTNMGLNSGEEEGE